MLKLYSFTFSPFQENTYLLADESGNAVIIDPGMFSEVEKIHLQSFMEKEGLRPVQVVLTHAHPDHVFGLKWTAEQYKLEPYMHAGEQIILSNAKNAGARYGLDFDEYTGPVHFLTEEDSIRLGENELGIFLIPGHSPGSIVFHSASQDFIIAGDTLFRESIGRTDLPYGNHEALVSNIKNKLFALPDHTKVYPGHGSYTTIGHEKQTNIFLR